MTLMSHVTDARLRSPEVARRLGIGGVDVYRLIFDGELDGRPDRDGIVCVSEASVAAYLFRHPALDQSETPESDNRSASRIPPEFPPSSPGLGITSRDETAPTIPRPPVLLVGRALDGTGRDELHHLSQ